VRFVHLKLKNWRNFLDVDVPLEERVFLIGPNGVGKSNLLDVFQFLRDVAEPGGLRRAIDKRGGVGQLRSLYAPASADVSMGVTLERNDGWACQYALSFNEDKLRRPVVRRERVTFGTKVILKRPEVADRKDRNRLTQTHLEQVNANEKFRELAVAFASVRHLHLIPQIVREPERWSGRSRDPFGGDFLEQVAGTPAKALRSRLRRIQDALKMGVPQMQQVGLLRDKLGIPHLNVRYERRRPHAPGQTEQQLSDGTLRLFGLLWVLSEGPGTVLLEEPELSLHAAVVRQLPSLMARLSRKNDLQVMVSTHSAEMLSDEGIAPEEVLLLEPSSVGTRVRRASADEQVRALVQGGLSIADAALPRTALRDADRLAMFE
jgi:predicted ATPase